MDSAAIIARLKAEVPDLHDVGVAADLAAILEGKLPNQSRTSAFVVAMNERGSTPGTAANAFTQELVETIAIILTIRSIDNRAGDKAVDEIEGLKSAIRTAIAGWAPDGAMDVYALSRGSVLAFKPGYFAYAMEFTTSDQLRILS